jgi:RNA polymerase sigma-70 factor, ECF subfamily
MEKNQGIIFKVSSMYCPNKECRKDLFQEIIMQLWRSFPSYNGKSKFSSWMYRVAINTAISQFRKDKRSKIDFVSDISENFLNEELFEEKEERIQILQKAIGKLSKGEKAIIILYMDDYPYEEIAEIVGISISNVGVKINRIKKKLQQILKELGYGL